MKVKHLLLFSFRRMCIILQKYFLTWIFLFYYKEMWSLWSEKIRKENKFSTMKLANTNVSCTWSFKSLHIYSFYKKNILHAKSNFVHLVKWQRECKARAELWSWGIDTNRCLLLLLLHGSAHSLVSDNLAVPKRTLL